MNEKLLEPLKYYESEGRDTHLRYANEHFDALLEKSGVDVNANRATVKEYNSENDKVNKTKARVTKFKTLRVLLIIAIVIGAICFLAGVTQLTSSVGLGIGLMAGGAVAIGLSIFGIVKINPRIKEINKILDIHLAKASELLAKAQEQMAPLNALFDERDTIDLIERTIPELDFEERYTKEQEELLNKHYDFIDLESDDCSMVNVMSGKFEGNPFLFCQALMHELKSETYHGSLVISWTETYRDSNGKIRTRRRTQTLHASVTKPKPYYHLNNYLGYGSQAASELTFSRSPQISASMDEKDIEKKIKKGEKKLKKKAERSLESGGTFQEMANSEFDVLFGASNRNNEVQFRLMYTPLAQKNTVSLIKSKVGYGDDFYFTKHKRFNIITSNHAQRWNMSTSPTNYYSYDVDIAREKFLSFNKEYFKSVFFDFAPLFCVPAYLEEPCASLDKPEEYESYYPYYEHEAVANAMDRSVFIPEGAISDAILKTQFIKKTDSSDLVSVTALTYYTAQRVDIIPVLGGDGRMHGVPVHWTEYIPTSKTSSILVSSANMTRKEYKNKLKADEGLLGSALLHGIIAKKYQEEH